MKLQLSGWLLILQQALVCSSVFPGMCVRGVTSSDLLVFCSLRPGPHYFCASLLSQSPNFLLLTFLLFHGSDLAKCKLYDHITPLLKIFGWLPIVLRIESRLAVLASRSLCALTVVSFFCFMALFHPQSCPSPVLQCTIVLSYAFHASLWACCLRPVSAVTPPPSLSLTPISRSSSKPQNSAVTWPRTSHLIDHTLFYPVLL